MLVPDKDDKKENWTVKVELSDKPREWWTLEAIRQVNLEDIYSASPFNDKTVIGLLDHQTRCTIIDPIISGISPGSIGVHLNYQKTTLTGSFRALLTGLSISDFDEELFAGFSFSSSAFSRWYHRRSYQDQFDYEKKKHAIKIEDPRESHHHLHGVGSVECYSRAEVSSTDDGHAIANSTQFKMKFDEAVSLKGIMRFSIGIDRVFNFLVGCRSPYPIVKVWTKQTYLHAGFFLPFDGAIKLSGGEWVQSKIPHPMECINLNGQGGGSVETIIESFLKNEISILDRIYAVEFSRFFSSDLNARFSVIMPTFEDFLKQRFIYSDEKDFLQHEKNFWAWMELSRDDSIIEFGKKHLDVRRRKSPSLQTMIKRSIVAINQKGFKFPTKLASDISKRRAKVFHSVPQMSSKEVYQYHLEIKAITGLLLLHTIMDLGIEISYLKSDYHSLSFMREFLYKEEQRHDTSQENSQDKPLNTEHGVLSRDDWSGDL